MTRYDSPRRLLALTALLLALPAPLRAASPAPSEIEATVAVHAAAARAGEARLELARDRLDRLRAMRSRGHASWLEVAREETLVAEMAARRDAAAQLHAFVVALAERIGDVEGEQTTTAPGAESTAFAIRLAPPGSVRLVGWLAPEATARDVARRELAAELAVGKQAAPTLEQIDALRAEVARCTERLDRFSADETTSPDRRRAELQQRAARAELDLARAARRQVTLRQEQLEGLAARLDENAGSDRQSGNRAPLVDPTASPALRAATRRIATLEAEATGATRAAEIAVAQQEIRHAALLELRDRGFARGDELAAAEARLDAAREQLDRLRAAQTARRRLLAELAALPDDSPNTALTAAAADDSASAEGFVIDPAELPAEFLSNPALLRHLVELEADRQATRARRAGLLAEREMRAELARRLERANRDTPGGNRERELARLDVERTGALLAASEERLAALACELPRCVEQFRVQLAASDAAPRDKQIAAPAKRATPWWSLTPPSGIAALFTAVAAPLAPTTPAGWLLRGDAPFGTPAGYLESPAGCDCLSVLRPSSFELFLAERTLRDPHAFYRYAYGRSGYSSWRRGYYSGYDRASRTLLATRLGFEACRSSLYASSISGSGRLGGNLCFPSVFDPPGGTFYPYVRHTPKFVSNIPSYSKNYSFGIRNYWAEPRPSRRRSATPYGGPWYLPGAPTNYR